MTAKKNIAKSLILSGLLVFAGYPVFAAGTGTKAADFLKVSAGARPEGLGEAFVAVADETSGMFYNPAGPAYIISPEIQATHGLWLGDMTYSYAGYTMPTVKGAFVFAGQYFSAPGTPKIVNGVKYSDFQYYDALAALGYSFKMSEGSSLGINLKNISSQIDTSQESALTGDLGLLFRTPQEGFSFGIAGSNLFGQMGGDNLPMTARAGMAFKASLPEHYSDILFSVEGGQTSGEPAYLTAGLEHWGAKTLGLRVGYKYFLDDRLNKNMYTLPPVRGGISLRIGSMAVDYAYQPFAALGETHRLSITWRLFGWGVQWIKVGAKIKAEPAIFSPNSDGSRDSVFFVPQSVDIKDIKTWQLSILDSNRSLIRAYSGKDVLPKIITWEGQMDGGKQASEGKYYYFFGAEGDGRKRARSVTGEIVIDLTAPDASITLSNPVLALAPDGLVNPVTFYAVVGDSYTVEQWQLSIINDKGRAIKVFKSTYSWNSEIPWDGVDDYYGAVVPNGDYDVKLSVWDMAGNKTVKFEKIKVYTAPKVEIKEVVKEVQVKEESRGLVVNLASQVLFDVGKSVLKPAASKAMEEVVKLLKSYPENDVMIEGFTDSTGSRSKNIDLSSARAWAIYSHIVKSGVAPARLKVKGYGPDKPVA